MGLIYYFELLNSSICSWKKTFGVFLKVCYGNKIVNFLFVSNSIFAGLVLLKLCI